MNLYSASRNIAIHFVLIDTDSDRLALLPLLLTSKHLIGFKTVTFADLLLAFKDQFILHTYQFCRLAGCRTNLMFK